jgi:hypothetical protein
MNGFLMKIKLYNKIKSAHDTFDYEEHTRKTVEQKLEESRKGRIELVPKDTKKKVKVNQEFFEELRQKAVKKKTTAKPEEILEDQRFKRVFTDKDFAIDRTSEAYLLAHPSERTKRGTVITEEVDEGEEDGSEMEDLAEMRQNADEEDEDDENSEEEDDDDEEGPTSLADVQRASDLPFEKKMEVSARLNAALKSDARYRKREMLKQSKHIKKGEKKQMRTNMGGFREGGRNKRGAAHGGGNRGGKRVTIPLKKLLK